MTTIDLTNVLALAGEIAQERLRQHEKWGEQNHPDGFPGGWAGHADWARESCQLAAAENRVTWLHILREEVAEVFAAPDASEKRRELVQVAAVAAAWIEAIDRRSPAEAEDRPDLVDALFSKPMDSNDDASPSTQDTPQAAETAPVVHPDLVNVLEPILGPPLALAVATEALAAANPAIGHTVSAEAIATEMTESAPTDAPALAGLDEAIVAGFHAITDDDHTVTESGLAAIAVRAAYPVIRRAVLLAAADQVPTITNHVYVQTWLRASADLGGS